MAIKTVGVYLLEPGYCFVHVAGLVPISERVIALFLQVYKYWARSFFFVGAMVWIVGDS